MLDLLRRRHLVRSRRLSSSQPYTFQLTANWEARNCESPLPERLAG